MYAHGSTMAGVWLGCAPLPAARLDVSYAPPHNRGVDGSRSVGHRQTAGPRSGVRPAGMAMHRSSSVGRGYRLMCRADANSLPATSLVRLTTGRGVAMTGHQSPATELHS